MGLFTRSRASSRASNAPPPQVPPTSAAAIAALQAAASSSESTRLAAGAAAAALRSQTATPVDPGNVTTKRMLRRSSISSNTSNTSYQHGRPQLERRGSVGSMTSRSFRSPSPHGQQVPADPNAPPVPALPRTISPAPSLMTKRTFRRPASTEPIPRVTSPTPAKGARFQSVDTAAKRASRPAAIRTSFDEASENRIGNRNSINFSRPMSPDVRPNPESPTASTMRIKKQSGGQPTPLGRSEIAQLEFQYQRTANEPVSRRRDLAGAEGSHFAAGTMGHRPTGTAVPESSSSPMSPNTRPQRIPLPRRISEEPDDLEEEPEFEQVFDPHTRTMIKRRKPGWKPKPQKAPTPARVASPVSAYSPAGGRVVTSGAVTSPATVLPAPATERPLAPTPAKAKQVPREPSHSPARVARFSLQPETTPAKHEPSRSVSPRKSALKTSPSPRRASPAGPPEARSSWNQPGFSPSEASDTMSQTSESQAKRRSVRVSFDDQPTMIGTSMTPSTSVDSPIVLSPQEKKRSWFGLKKKQQDSDESEAAYAPTPALPTFGSVRGKKDGPAAVLVNSPEEAEEALTSAMGVALTTGEKTPGEAGSALDAGSGVARKAKDEAADEVPTIAIDPGTPGLETTKASPFDSEPVEPEPSSPVKDLSPALVGIAEPEPEGAAAVHDPHTPTVGHVAEDIVKHARSDSDEADSNSDDSHYSDANEDADAAMDGDGFGSINAIVDSPVVGAKEPAVKMAEAVPPLTSAPSKEISAVAASEAGAGALGKETTTFREASAQDDGAIVSDTTKEAAGAEKVTETIEDSEDGTVLVPTARLVAGPVDETKQSVEPKPADDATTRNAPAPKASAPESVSFNPRRPHAVSNPPEPKAFEEADGWAKTQSYWSDLNAQRKATVTDDDALPLPQSSAYPMINKSPRGSVSEEAVPKGTASNEPGTPQRPAVQPSSTTSTPIRTEGQPRPLKSALKKSTASPNPDRRSMPPPNAAAASALANTKMPEARGTLSKKNRPMSMAAMSSSQPNNHDAAIQLAQAIVKVQNSKSSQEKSSLADPSHRRSGSYASISGQAPSKRGSVPAMPKLRRKNSSDSDSSFKRAPSVTSEGGRVSMRRSMRANAPGRPQSMAGSSLRQGPSTTAAGRPMSMRMNSGGGQTVRQQRQASPTRSLLGFKKPARASSMQAPRARISRTYADSDDEDEHDVPALNFSSRFNDSDDDEVPPLRPVRGIPKKSGAARLPSPDLDDSDSEFETAATVTGTNGTGATHATSATADERLLELARQRLGIEKRPDVPDPAATEAAHSPLGDDKRFTQSDLVSAFAEKKAVAKADSTLSKRRSIFGGFGRKRGNSKVEKSNEESLARKDTPLERTLLERQNLGNHIAISRTESTPQKPKPARQNTQERVQAIKDGINPDSWPLPQSPTVVRPSTAEISNGNEVTNGVRPPLGRHFSADGVPLGRKGNKKKFMALRRAFGLHD